MGKYDKGPMRANNMPRKLQIFEDARNLISGLRTPEGLKILSSLRACGFKGLLITMKSFELIMQQIINGEYEDLRLLQVKSLCNYSAFHFYCYIVSTTYFFMEFQLFYSLSSLSRRH